MKGIRSKVKEDRDEQERMARLIANQKKPAVAKKATKKVAKKATKKAK